MAQVNGASKRAGGGGVGKKGRKQTSLRVRASSPIWASEASLARTRHARAELLFQLFCSLRLFLF